MIDCYIVGDDVMHSGQLVMRAVTMYIACKTGYLMYMNAALPDQMIIHTVRE